MRIAPIILAVALAVVAAPAHASLHGDFVRAWDARDQSYRAERAALDARAKGAADRAIAALVEDDPTAGEDLSFALTAAWSLSELVGRGETLGALREHMASKPSAALSEMWMQGKVDELRRRKADADLVERQMEILRGRDTVSVAQWIAALEQVSMMLGNISGSAAELELIGQNLRTYYQARSPEQSASAARWAEVLLALGAAARDRQAAIQERSADCAQNGKCEE